MNPKQLFCRARNLDNLDPIEIELGASYLKLVKEYYLEDFVYPNQVFENIKQECDFIHEYKSYHIGYFLEDGRFYSFSGLSSLKHVYFNSKNLVDAYKVAMIGSAFMPQMSLFIDIDSSSERFESVFIQNINELDDSKSRIYVAINIKLLIEKLVFYMVGTKEKLLIL